MSSESLFSQYWYRVADLKPRLGSHVMMTRHAYRGQRWFMLQDSGSGRHHRLNDLAHTFVARMNGTRSVEAIWQILLETLGDACPSQDEIIQILSQLYQANLIQCDITPESEEVLRRRDSARRRTKIAMLNPLAFRIPLWNPENFLSRNLPQVRWLFKPASALLWLMIVVWATFTAFAYSGDIARHAATYTLTPRYLLLLWLCYPLIKALHEMGHAFMLKAWGGEVHEMGVSFMLLLPVPYVDASSASGFPDKRQRMLVGAAGIAVELLIASLGLAVWLNTQPGLLNDLGFVALLIGGVSTLVFNGNPLFKYDGYYILADALEIPNLASRSTQCVIALLQRYLLRIPTATSPAASAAEQRWLLAYAFASFTYRLIVFAWILVWASAYSLVAGLAIGAMMGYTLGIKPGLRAFDYLLHAPALVGKRAQGLVLAGVLLVLPLLVLATVPWPNATEAEGIVWLPEHARIRAGGDGFIEKILLRDGQRVEAGQALLVIHDPAPEAEARKLEAKVQGLEAARQQAYILDPTRAQIILDTLAQTRAELALVTRAMQQRVVRSRSSGIFVMPHPQDLPGRYVTRGEVLAHVLSPSQIIARVAVAQEDVALIRTRQQNIHVRFAEAPGRAWPAHLLREVPAGGNRLPSAALGDRGGGRFATDPHDPDGVDTLEPFFLFDLSLPDTDLKRIGGRVRVRFEHASQPLLMQWTRRLRQVFLEPLNR